MFSKNTWNCSGNKSNLCVLLWSHVTFSGCEWTSQLSRIIHWTTFLRTQKQLFKSFLVHVRHVVTGIHRRLRRQLDSTAVARRNQNPNPEPINHLVENWSNLQLFYHFETGLRILKYYTQQGQPHTHTHTQCPEHLRFDAKWNTD